MSVTIIKPISKEEICSVCEYISQFGVRDIETKIHSFEKTFFSHLGETITAKIDFRPSNIAALIELINMTTWQVFDISITFAKGKLKIKGLSSYEFSADARDLQAFLPLIQRLNKSEPYSFKINLKSE